jgi:alkylation response protein AidB-like acyl-CoA dehydrogenase
MDLLTPEQQKVQQSVREFVEKHIIPVAGDYDKSAAFHEFLLEEASKAGYLSMAVPKEYGGTGYDSVTQALIFEAWGYGCVGFGTTLAASCLSADSLLVAGNPEQKKLYFGALVKGGLGAFALTEPGAGSDAGSGTTTAKKVGNEYVLNGTKCFISNGGYAKVYVVFAITDPSKGLKGISAFVVEREREGLVVGAVEHKLGIRSSNTVELLLRDVKVPESHLLGKEGDGMKIAMKTLDLARPPAGALAVGVAQRALDECVKFFKAKYGDGKPQPGQAAQFRLADMEIQIQAARQLCLYAFACRDSGLPFTKESAIAKTFCTDTGMKVTTDALNLLGSYGYSDDCVVGKLVRDAKILQIYEGTNQVQRLVIARQVLAGPVPAKNQAKTAGR